MYNLVTRVLFNHVSMTCSLCVLLYLAPFPKMNMVYTLGPCIQCACMYIFFYQHKNGRILKANSLTLTVSMIELYSSEYGRIFNENLRKIKFHLSHSIRYP